MRGRDAKTYYDDIANWASPTWTEIKGIIDEDVTPSVNLATGGSREEEYEDNEVASRKFEWNATYRYKQTPASNDTVYTDLMAAYVAGTPLMMAFVDKDVSTSGAYGWRAPILIDQVPQKRNLGDLVEVTVHGVAKLYNDSGTIRKAATYTSPGFATTTTTATP